MSTLPADSTAIVKPSTTNSRDSDMTPADRQFGKELGRRLAQLRQEAGLTQQAVADHLGIAQQTLAHYEVGRLGLPVALVPKLAELFDVPTDVLLGVASAATAKSSGKRGPTPKLQRQLERLSRLPKAQQQVILAMLDGVLLQQHG
jgi:transcriptional regulator with XRE-family HTH domain